MKIQMISISKHLYSNPQNEHNRGFVMQQRGPNKIFPTEKNDACCVFGLIR